jgi:anti-anti-sigma factor
MEITIKPEGSVTVISITDKLDMATSGQMAEAFTHQLQDGQVKLVADFSRLTYLSSAGLRVLLTATKEARARGGDLRLAAIQSNEVDKVLRMSGLSNILKVYPDTALAIASFAA